MSEKEALLEQYKSLRQEIMKRQDQRLLILGFTVTGVGGVIGLLLRREADGYEPVNQAAIALIGFIIVVIIAAIILTIQMTRQIEVISSYIIKFIEPFFSGLTWESSWQRYRESKRGRFSFVGVPLGTSKPLAVYYGFLTIATYALAFPTGIYKILSFIVPLTLIAIISLCCSLDLYYHKTKGWKTGWDIVD